jgi:hypothetical protein
LARGRCWFLRRKEDLKLSLAFRRQWRPEGLFKLAQAPYPDGSNSIGGFISQGFLTKRIANVTFRGIGYGTRGDSVTSAQIYGISLAQGVSFHVQLPFTNSFGWFLRANSYLNASRKAVPAFLDPASSALHLSQ